MHLLLRLSLCFLACLADSRVEPGRNFLLSLIVGVLIDQRRLLGGLPCADHRVLEGGTRARGQRMSGVPEMVEPEALGQLDDLTRLPPLPPRRCRAGRERLSRRRRAAHRGPAQRTTPGASEAPGGGRREKSESGFRPRIWCRPGRAAKFG